MPQAFRVKEEILEQFKDAKVELELGSGGNFIVEVDGEVIFSKRELDVERFPNEGEIVSLLK